MDIKKLQIYLTSAEFVEETEKLFNVLEKDQLFNTGLNENDYQGLPIGRFRELQVKRFQRLLEYGFTWLKTRHHHLVYVLDTINKAIGMRRGINFGVCVLKSFFVVLFFGSEIFRSAWNKDIVLLQQFASVFLF